LIEVLNQPWSTIVVFVSGYIAYHIANTGIRDHHKTIDITFATLVFGFFSMFGYYSAIKYADFKIPVASTLAVLSAIFLGVFWRLLGRSWYQNILRSTRVSESDDLPTAWTSLFDETGHDVTQISVKTKDGAWLQCADTRKFANKPNGPCVLGAAGDVLIYVTDYTPTPDSESKEISDVSYEGWGDEITFIPKEEIIRVAIRRIKKTSPFS